MSRGWIGVDLDGTLAEYDGWQGVTHIGEPVPAMLQRVAAWLDQGITVKIVTARVSDDGSVKALRERQLAKGAIQAWCVKHLGQPLEVVCEKDYGMFELWDDRAVTVEQNTGRVIKHPRGEVTP